jgi:hypothetical protein
MQRHTVSQGGRTVGTLGISGEIQMRFESTPAAAGKFVITLCSVATPVTIPQPRSPELTRFRFFLGQSLEGDRKRYTLYMGHFSTLAEAEKWLKVLRGIYPDAYVSEESAKQTDSFSDTQVLSILEERRADRATTGADETDARKISLLRPEDELELAPRHPIFGSYTLYTTQARLEGREWFCLRLGFFSDAISAKQVAQFLYSDFPSVAVVPVNPQEHATALATGKRSAGAVLSATVRPHRDTDAGASQATRNAAAKAPAPVKRAGVTLEDTLETLRTNGFAMDNDEESNTTGVRHLQVITERSVARQAKSSRPQRRKL